MYKFIIDKYTKKKDGNAKNINIGKLLKIIERILFNIVILTGVILLLKIL